MSRKSSSARLASLLRTGRGRVPSAGPEAEERLGEARNGIEVLVSEMKGIRTEAHWAHVRDSFLTLMQLYRFAQLEPNPQCKINRRRKIFGLICLAAARLLKRLRTLCEFKRKPDLSRQKNALAALERAARFFGSGQTSPTEGQPRPGS